MFCVKELKGNTSFPALFKCPINSLVGTSWSNLKYTSHICCRLYWDWSGNEQSTNHGWCCTSIKFYNYETLLIYSCTAYIMYLIYRGSILFSLLWNPSSYSCELCCFVTAESPDIAKIICYLLIRYCNCTCIIKSCRVRS